MRVGFRQGIVSHTTDAAGNPIFLNLAGGTVSIVVAPEPVVLTFADGTKDFLFNEPTSVPNAWTGPFVSGTEFWLFWDIDRISGIRTFGHTLLAPIVSNTKPSAINDQHWFNPSTFEMKVVINGSFVKKHRVFAGKIDLSFSIVSISDQAPAFTGTQIGNNIPGNHGSIVRDLQGIPFTNANGQFFTTEEEFITGVSSSAQQKIQTSLIRAEATSPMSAFTVVEFTSFNKISPANPFIKTDRVFGIIDSDALTGDIVNVTIVGVIVNPAWNFTTANAPLYGGLTGQLQETQAVPDQVPVGFIIGKNTIVIRPLSITTFDGDPVLVTGDTMTGPLILFADPTDPLEATTKNYVDTEITNHITQATLDFVNTIGDTMTGFLTLSADPTAALHAVTKQYVDAQDTVHTILVNNPHTVTKTQVGLGNVVDTLNNFAATVPPTTTDDSTAGYTIGSFWIDTVSDACFCCVDSTASAAVWQAIRQDTDALWGNITGTLSNQIDLQLALNDKSDVSHNHDTVYVNLTGDTMTGLLTLSAGPTVALHAATKQYVDNEITTHDHDTVYVNLTGDTMTGQLVLSGDPTIALHAATKQYVDTSFTNHLAISNPHSITKNTIGLSQVQDILNNFAAIGPPTNNDDSTLNYSVGSFWFDITADRAFTCLDATATAAVWIDIGIADIALVWGQATGTLSNQTDLQAALDNKSDLIHNHDTLYINVTGDTMTGSLTLSADPTLALQAATKQFVDNHTWVEADITDLQSYLLPANIGVTVAALLHSHSATDITSGTLVDARVVASNVIQHQTALTITESQISDLQAYALNSSLTTHTGNTGNPHNVSKSQVSLGNVENLKVNLTAIVAPAATDDASLGYSIGSLWVDTVADKAFICADATAASAVWVEITVQGGGTAVWGSISGTLSNQTDLQSALDGKAASIHSHVEADITDLQSYLLDITGSPFSDLSDVTITAVTSGEMLKWTGTAWINNTLAEAGIAAAGHSHMENILKAGDTMVGFLTLNADPTAVLHAATKQYVDSVAAGIDPKASARLATTATLGAVYATTPNNGQFTGAPTTIDTIAIAQGDRILVKNQTDAKQNGIFEVQAISTTWIRAADHDGTPTNEVSAGNFIFIEQGAVNADTGWVLQGNGILTLNTNNIDWVQFSSSTSLVSSVFGRTGTVAAVSGDYTASEVTNIPAGTIAAVTVQAAINELDSEKLALGGGILSGTLAMAGNTITDAKLDQYSEKFNNVGTAIAAQTIDLANGNDQAVTISVATVFTFSNPAASGTTSTLVLEIINGGSAAVTWPTSVKWPGGTPPTLAAVGTDIISFRTRDGGVTWYGMVGGLAFA